MRESLKALTDSDPQHVFLRLRLVGEVGPDCAVDRARIVGQHKARYAALVVEDATEPLLDIQSRAERKGLDGLFVRKLQQRIAALPPRTNVGLPSSRSWPGFTRSTAMR